MSKPRTGCSARQQSDQMTCDRCGLVWDMNDPDPPACLSERERVRVRLRRLREQIQQQDQLSWICNPNTPTERTRGQSMP